MDRTNSVLHPLWLTFHDAKAETIFRRNQHEHALRSDRWLLTFAASLRAFCLVWLWRDGYPTSDIIVSVVFFVPLIFELAFRNVLERRSRELVVRWRKIVTPFLRWFIFLGFVTIVPKLMARNPIDHSTAMWKKIMWHIVFGTGIQVHIACTFCLPLPLPYHIPTQCLISISTVVISSHHYCERVTSSAMRDSTELLAWALDWMFNFGLTVEQGMPGSSFGETRDIQSSVLCMENPIFLNVFGGCIVLSLVWWVIESRRRMEFLESCNVSGQCSKEDLVHVKFGLQYLTVLMVLFVLPASVVVSGMAQKIAALAKTYNL